MSKGFNIMMRNMKASFTSFGSEFHQRLVKATYNGDLDEPKEKHVFFIIECFKNNNTSIVS
jgi:hypothetical protein